MLMWSHYADSHNGICVGYNVSDILSNSGFFLLPVVYSDSIPSIDFDLEYYNIGDPLFPLLSIATKSLDWEYEQEWRIVQSCSPNPPASGIPIDMPAPCEIYCGLETDISIIKKIKKCIKEHPNNTINLQRMIRSENDFRLSSTHC